MARQIKYNQLSFNTLYFHSLFISDMNLLRLTDFCRTVNVLDGENRSQAVQENFRQGWYELCCGHQHVDTVTPVGHR